MLTQAKLYIDSMIWSLSKKLAEPKWLYSYLASKWILTLALIFVFGQWAYFNDALLILITPIVVLPKIIKNDLQRIKSCTATTTNAK
ncbi:hypothetical protein EDC56_3706 [Sinobacterium caligoides]|uniref:Uncharacterized protein n=1 Tax=Sinobacterium caligoides TaxID=933926 RepID=A0A3N2D567_9GAMM|nr:hypothetical protein EDC56_3706 [Sinobacterium caligoides]